MQTFAHVGDVARDAEKRVTRVAVFFEVVFVVVVVALVAIDLAPRKPRIECEIHTAQTMSHYPHPYGEPPAVQWTTCAWK